MTDVVVKYFHLATYPGPCPVVCVNGNEALAPVIIRVKVQLVGKLSSNRLKLRPPPMLKRELGFKLGSRLLFK